MIIVIKLIAPYNSCFLHIFYTERESDLERAAATLLG